METGKQGIKTPFSGNSKTLRQSAEGFEMIWRKKFRLGFEDQSVKISET